MKLPSNRFFLFGCVLTVILLATTARYLIGKTDVFDQQATDILQTSKGTSLINQKSGPTSTGQDPRPQLTSKLSLTISQSPRKTEKQTSNSSDITIVTMYINIGKFQKGGGYNYFTTDTYKNWMNTWSWLTNRVVAFFDQDETLELFRKVRSSQPADRTVLIKLNRSEIPAFKDLEKVRAIFNTPNYPRHPPNTVVPEYALAMNAKFDVLQMAISKDLVPTKYMAWLDIGLFRNLLSPNLRPKGDTFTLEVPDNFDPTSVSMTEVTPRNQLDNLTPKDFIWNNAVWVSGAFSLATKEVMLAFTNSYKKTVADLLAQNLASTDQQVIGIMYSPANIKQQVTMKPYTCRNGQFGLYSSDIQYFCLGYVCKDAAYQRQINQKLHLR